MTALTLPADNSTAWGQTVRDALDKLNRLGIGQAVFATDPGVPNLAAIAANGTTNDAPALQAQIDYVAATWGSGTVYLPGKTIRCNSGLTVPVGVKLVGVSRVATTLDFSGAGSSVVAVTSLGQGTRPLEHLTLRGPNGTSKIGYPTNTSTGVNLGGIGCSLSHVGIERFFYGIDCTNPNTFFFHGDNVFVGYAGVGLNLNGTAEANGGTAPNEFGERMVLTNSAIYNSQLGFDLAMSGVTLFATNCSFDYLGKHGRVADSFCHLTNCHLETGYAGDNGNWGSQQRFLIEMLYTGRATFTACRFEVRDSGVYSAISPYSGPWYYNSGHVRFNDCTWYGTIPTGGARQYQSRDMIRFENNSLLELVVYSPFATKWNTIAAYPVATDSGSTPAGWSVRVKASDVTSVAGGTPSQAVTLERVPPPGATTPYPAMWANVDY